MNTEQQIKDDIYYQPDSMSYKYLKGLVDTHTNDKITLKEDPKQFDFRSENEIFEFRRKHLEGDKDHFMGNTGYVDGKRTYKLGFDIDKIYSDEMRQEYVDRILNSNLKETVNVSISKSGQGLHVYWIFSPGKKTVYPKAESFYDTDKGTHLAIYIAEGMGFYTKDQLKKLGKPVEGFLDLRGLYPSPNKGNPQQLFLDYWNGLNQPINGVYNPKDPTKLLTHAEFIELLKGGRTITKDIAANWFMILKHLTPCQRRTYILGLDEGSRNNSNMPLLAGYFQNNPRAKLEKLCEIMRNVCKFDESFYEEGKAQARRVYEGEQNFGHVEYFCDKLCIETTKANGVDGDNDDNEEQGSDSVVPARWKRYVKGKFWATTEKTALTERIKHYFEFDGVTASGALPRTASFSRIEKLAKDQKVGRMFTFPNNSRKDLFYNMIYFPMVEKQAEQKIEYVPSGLLFLP